MATCLPSKLAVSLQLPEPCFLWARLPFPHSSKILNYACEPGVSQEGPVVFALQKYPFITVFPVHALSLARYRQTFWPSGAKDDPQDAELALELMLRYPKKIKAIEPDNADIRLLHSWLNSVGNSLKTNVVL